MDHELYSGLRILEPPPPGTNYISSQKSKHWLIATRLIEPLFSGLDSRNEVIYFG